MGDTQALDHPLFLLLLSMAVQCQNTSVAPAKWSDDRAVPREAPVCLLVNNFDPVADAEAARRWTTSFSGVTVREYQYLGHLSLSHALRQHISGPPCAGLPL